MGEKNLIPVTKQDEQVFASKILEATRHWEHEHALKKSQWYHYA